MGKKTTRANNAFLLGSIIMIVLVLALVVAFVFMAFKIHEKKASFAQQYEIHMGQTLTGVPTSVYMNDSLLFQGIPGAPMTFAVARFSDQSTLLVVDGRTDMVTAMELPLQTTQIRIEQDSLYYFVPETATGFSISR